MIQRPGGVWGTVAHTTKTGPATLKLKVFGKVFFLQIGSSTEDIELLPYVTNYQDGDQIHFTL